MAKLLSGTRIYGTATVDTTLFVTGTDDATSATTGAVQVTGGVGVGGTLYVEDNVIFATDLEVNGGSITTTNITFNLLNTTATTVNAFGDANIIEIGAATGTTNFKHNVDIDLDLNVDGGDITTNLSTFNLLNATATTLNIGGDATAINVGATSGTITLRNPTIVGTQTTQNIYNTVATTVNFAGAATDVQIGAATGTTNINNNLDVDGDVNIDGGDLTVSTLTFNLANTTAETINFGGAATDLQIGAATGITNINNNLDVDGDVNIDGGDLTTNQTTFALLNTTATTVNFGGAATAIVIGDTSGTTNFKHNVDIDLDLNVDGGDLTTNQTTFNLLNTTATTVNFAGAATDVQIGSNVGTTTVKHSLDVDGDVNIDGGNLTVGTSIFDLVNTTAETVNFAGAATDLQIGASTGITNINNNLDVDGDVNIDGGDLTTNQTTFDLLNTTATTVNFAGAATAIVIGSNAGTTNVLNSFEVDINSRLGIDTDSINTINGQLTVNLKDNTADIFTIKEDTNNYIKINTNNSLELITFGILPTYNFLNETDASSVSVASTTFAGGVGIAKKLFVGTDLNVDGNLTLGNARSDEHLITGSLIVDTPDDTAIAVQIKENTQPYVTVVTSNGSESVTIESTPQLLVKNVTDSSSKDTGALIVEGGVGIEKNLTVGYDLIVDNNVTIKGNTVVSESTTFNLFNTTTTTVNFAGEATDLQIGAATGITNINNNLDVDGDVNIDGGDLTTNQTTFDLLNTTAETINFGGTATDLQIGAATGITNINNNLTVDGDVEIKGGDLTTDQTTFNLINTVAETINVGAGAVTINLGAASTIVNIGELSLTTDLEVQYGGTGRSTFTENGVIYGNTTDGLLVTAASDPGVSNETTSYGILTTDINNVPVWTDTIDGGSY